LKVRATAALVEKCDAELQAAQDELDDATEAHARAVRGDTLARLAKALEPAKAIDSELVTQGAPYYGIATLVDEITAAAEECATPRILDVELWTNDRSILRRPPERAIEDVASGTLTFVNPRDARKYAAQVEALKPEIEARKRAQAQGVRQLEVIDAGGRGGSCVRTSARRRALPPATHRTGKMLPIIVFIPLALIALAAIVARARCGLRARAMERR
jgi:hypothetical protein